MILERESKIGEKDGFTFFLGGEALFYFFLITAVALEHKIATHKHNQE